MRPVVIRGSVMKKPLLFLFLILATPFLHAQYEGIWEGYDGEWESCFPPVDSSCRGHTAGQIRVASCAWSEVDERGVYAYRFGQFLLA